MRCAVAFRWVRLGVLIIAGAASPAHAEDMLLRPFSAAPADLLGVPQAQPLGGISLAAAFSAQVGHRPATGRAKESYRLGLDLLVSASFYLAQIDVSFPLRLGFSLPDTGSPKLKGAVDPVRVGGKLVLPWLYRKPTERGYGIAVTFTADVWDYNSDQPRSYIPGFVVDYRFSWIYFTAYTAVPFHTGDAPLAVDVGLGGGMAMRLCRGCPVTLGAVVDGSVAVTDPPDDKRLRARGALLLQGQWTRGLFVRLWGAIPLDDFAPTAITAGLSIGYVVGAGRTPLWTTETTETTPAQESGKALAATSAPGRPVRPRRGGNRVRGRGS